MATQRNDEGQSSSFPGTSLAAEGQIHSLPLTKRQKTRQKRNQKAVLAREARAAMPVTSALMDMPLDVFAEIAFYLIPRDLLRLARSSKRLRAVLMSKSARNMWKSARMNMEPNGAFTFPECPHDISEPEYASFVFDRFCMACGKGDARMYNFAIRERLCKFCSQPRKYKKYTKEGIVDFIEVCVAPGDVPPEISTLYSLVLCDPIGNQFCPATARHLYQQCMAHKTRLSSSSYDRYLQERQQLMGATIEHARVLGAWYGA